MEQPNYTPQQWEMTNRVMDLVDEQRHGAQAPWSEDDTRKVVALVQRTYQSQGIEVDQKVIDKALAIALKTLPERASAHATGPSPVDDARHHIGTVAQHTPFSNADLAQRIQQMSHALRKERQQRLFVKWGIQSMLAGGLAIAFFCVVVFSRSLFVFPVAVVLFWLSWGAFTRRFVNNQMRLSDIERLLDCQEQALGALDRGLYAEDGLKRWARTIFPAVDYYSISPLASDSSRWNTAAQAAEKEPTLFKVWGQWLASPAPLRDCDAHLMINAGDKVDQAMRFLNRDTEEAQAQNAAKQRLLKHHGTPGAR